MMGRCALGEAQSKELLRRYGIRTPREALAKSPQEAAQIASEIGYPVVLKIASPAVTHKSDIGGVLLGLRSEAELVAGYDGILGNARAHGIAAIDGVLVCEQVAGGVELALGVHRDPEMGLIVMAGGGGVLLEMVEDVAFASPPLDRAKARALLARTRVSRLIAGYRGSARCDLEAAIDALVALGPDRARSRTGACLDRHQSVRRPGGGAGRDGARRARRAAAAMSLSAESS